MSDERNECKARKSECTEEEWQAVMAAWREWRRTGQWAGGRQQDRDED